MNARDENGQTAGDAVTELAGLVAGLGIITMVLFPLALPAFALTALVLIPVVLVGLPLALAAAIVAVPVVAVRRLRRRNRHREGGVMAKGVLAGHH